MRTVRATFVFSCQKNNRNDNAKYADAGAYKADVLVLNNAGPLKHFLQFLY